MANTPGGDPLAETTGNFTSSSPLVFQCEGDGRDSEPDEPQDSDEIPPLVADWRDQEEWSEVSSDSDSSDDDEYLDYIADMPWANQNGSSSGESDYSDPDATEPAAHACNCDWAQNFGGCDNKEHTKRCANCSGILGCQCNCNPCKTGQSTRIKIRDTEYAWHLPKGSISLETWLFIKDLAPNSVSFSLTTNSMLEVTPTAFLAPKNTTFYYQKQIREALETWKAQYFQRGASGTRS